MSASALPSELLVIILSHLSSNKQTLDSCSLVDHRWFHTTRPFQFHTVAFSINLGIWHCAPSGYKKLAFNEAAIMKQVLLGQRCFDQSPEINTMVRHLQVHNTSSQDTYGWQLLQLQLSHIIRKFRNITQLTLNGMKWDAVSPELRRSLVFILDSPSLERLTLNDFAVLNVQDLAELLSFSPHLRKLELDNVGITRKSEVCSATMKEYIGAGTLIPNGTRLTSLSLSKETLDDALSWLLDPSISAIDFSALTHLTVNHINSTLAEDVRLQIFRRCSQSLQHLDLGYHFATTVKIPAGLKTLTIHRIHFISTLVNSLDGVNKMMALEAISLRTAYTVPSDDWLDLDRVLSKPELSKLTSLVVYVADKSEGPFLVEDLFPLFSKKGRIRMNGSF